MGKFGIGARVRDEDGDVGEIVEKRKGERRVQYGDDLLGIDMWIPKSRLTPIAANDDTPAPAEQEQGGGALASEDGRIRITATRFHIAGLDPTPEWQPKVGDRVRFKEDYCGTVLGETGEVKSSDPAAESTDGFLVGVALDSGKTQFVFSRRLEPLPVAAEAQGADGKASVRDILDELEAWFGDAIPVAVAPATATPIKKRDLVTLARSAMVTGFDPNNPAYAHIVLGTGGSYTLPVAALVAAA